jgi:hypothetical protein
MNFKDHSLEIDSYYVMLCLYFGLVDSSGGMNNGYFDLGILSWWTLWGY